MSFSYELSRRWKKSLDDKEDYWERVAESLVWTKKWNTVYDGSRRPYIKWFTGGELNLCYNCLDRHVQDGSGEKVVYIFDSSITKTYRTYTYAQVLNEVSRLAGVLSTLGVKRGDVVMICFPLIPEGAFSMLACARLGAFHVCITSGLKYQDISRRIQHCKPKLIILGSHGYHSSGWMNYKEEMDKAIEVSESKPEKVLVFQRTEQEQVSMTTGRDVDWNEAMSKASPVECVSIEANEPSFMIYTSGSTGEPKAIVHAGGLFAVRWIHDVTISFCPSSEYDTVVFSNVNYGWIAGAMVIAYGCPMGKITSVIFENDSMITEDYRLLYSSMEKSGATNVSLRSGIWKHIRGQDPDGVVASEYNLTRLSFAAASGERIDMGTMEWLAKTLKVNVWNCYGQTEAGCMICGIPDPTLGKENTKVHDFGALNPGIEVKILTDNDEEAAPFETGRVFIRHGVSPSSFVAVYGDSETYEKQYFSDYPGYMNTMDNGCKDGKGRLRIESRGDDQMKVGLHYVTSQAIEEIAMQQRSILECVCVSATDIVWKEIPVIIFIKKPGSDQTDEEIEKEVHKMVHKVHGTTLKLGRLVAVKELPYTRTGKIHRPSCRAVVRGQDYKKMGAVENFCVLPDIYAALVEAGYGKNVLQD